MKQLSLRYILIGSFIILSSIFLVHYKILGQAIYGDGRFYWAYTRSVLKDHDLDLRNELNHEFSPRANNSLQERVTSKNNVFNWFPIGPSIAWIPSFIIADILANTLHGIYSSYPNNGYSDIYQIIIGLQNILFVSVGITILYRLLTNYFNPLISLLAIILTLFGTNLLFYGGVDVINSHPVSFLLSSLFLFFWMNSRKKRTTAIWILLGILLGSMVMTRTQDAVFGLLFIFDLYNDAKRLIHTLLNLCLSGIAFLIVFSPQMFMWKYTFGNFFVSPYLLGGFNFLYPHIFEVLFNLRNGLLIWTPLYFVSFIGLIILRKKFFPLFCVSIALLYLITAWSGWNQGASFSIRMLIAGLPALSFGLAAVIKIINKKLQSKLFYSFIGFFVLYNMISIFLFLL